MGWMLDAELLWHDGMQSLSRESDIDPSSAKHQGCACDCISLSRIKSIWRTRHLWPPLPARGPARPFHRGSEDLPRGSGVPPSAPLRAPSLSSSASASPFVRRREAYRPFAVAIGEHVMAALLPKDMLRSHSSYDKVSTQDGELSVRLSHVATLPAQPPPVAVAKPPSRPPPSTGHVMAMRAAEMASKPSESLASSSDRAPATQQLDDGSNCDSLSTSTACQSAQRAHVSAAQPPPPSRPPPSKAFVESARQKQPATARAPKAPSISARTGADFHAHVGASVALDALQTVQSRLNEEARRAFFHRDFERALTAFRHAQSIAEKTASAGSHAEYGAIMHNIATCLHSLGELDGAREHYHAALAAFQRHPPSRVWVALYGDVDSRRCDFVRERLADVEAGRKPDLDTYLDGTGYRRKATADVLAPGRGEDRVQ